MLIQLLILFLDEFSTNALLFGLPQNINENEK